MAARARREDPDLTALLPTSILAHILSFLPLRSAFFCSTVSRPWLAALREMLARGVGFDFGRDFAAGLSLEQYSAAVDSILAGHQAPTLDRINIFLPQADCRIESRVHSWLELAASKKVRSLDLELRRFSDWQGRSCVIRGSVFKSRSLTRLSLSYCRFNSELEPLELPALRVLSLWEVDVSNETIAGVLTNCRSLETLKLTNCMQLRVLRIMSPPCLSSLTLNGAFDTLVIDAPLLKSFHLCSGHLIWNMVLKDVSNLDDAYYHGLLNFEELRHLFSALRHVTNLTLQYLPEVLYIVDLPNELPVAFSNLKTLHLHVSPSKVLKLLWGLFSAYNFPAIENLFIEIFSVRGPDQCHWAQAEMAALVFPLHGPKVVIIDGLVGFGDQIKVAGFILAGASALETLVMVSKMDAAAQLEIELPENELPARRDQLEALPRVSMNAQILFCGVDALAGMALPAPPHDEIHREALRAARSRI